MAQVVIIRRTRQRDLAKALIERAPVDAVVTIKEGSRSLDQNAKLWAMLFDIALAKSEGHVMALKLWKAAFMSALGHEIIWQPGIENAPQVSALRAGARRSSRTASRSSNPMASATACAGLTR